MQRKIQLTLAIFLCCASMAWAQQDSIYSLKECIETGIMNNLVLQSKGQEIQKSKFEITEYRTRLFPKIQAFGNFTNYIDKPTFGWLNWSGFDEHDEIELVGVCTDICVVSNALILKAMYPEAVISVDAGCCAGVTPEKHEAALETMKSCQIDVRGE